MAKSKGYGVVREKFESDGGFAVLYVINEWLFFYSIEKDPKYKRDQIITQQEAEADGHYKYLPYNEDTVPPDCYLSFDF